MFELVHALLLLIGIVTARLADPGVDCGSGPCPPSLDRPIESWAAPRALRADEFQLFARGVHRPGQPEAPTILLVQPERIHFVAPASQRLRAVLLRAPRFEGGAPPSPSAR